MSLKLSLDDDATQQCHVNGARLSLRVVAALLTLWIGGGPLGSQASDQGSAASASKEPPAASHQKDGQKEGHKEGPKEKESQKEGEGKQAGYRFGTMCGPPPSLALGSGIASYS